VFSEVGLRYSHRRAHALTAVSVTIEAGETVALVGASGSGKSSLVNLIPRFYLPTEGRILLDGIDIADLDLTSLRRNIALVSQDILLFNDSIRNNIAYGALRGVGTREVLEAAEAAHVLEFVRELPDGLETLVGENGVRLSGGQRQRLAIARAILKDAPVLILDEATSSLDAASERHIQEALETLRRGRTCLIIAHRLSTIQKADRIIVLENGRIEALGRHEDLIRRQGVYTTLYRIQSRAREAG
jgi:ATP-binding cassette, subfamily B, bacterial MsbA